MEWIAFGRFWRVDKYLLHIFEAFVVRRPGSTPGILESTWICYKATIMSSNNLSDCTGYLIIKQGGFFVFICATVFWILLCCSAAAFCPNSCCLYLKKLYASHFCLTMRKEPQVTHKTFTKKSQDLNTEVLLQVFLSQATVSVQKSRHLFLWGNCFKSITAPWIGR